MLTFLLMVILEAEPCIEAGDLYFIYFAKKASTFFGYFPK